MLTKLASPPRPAWCRPRRTPKRQRALPIRKSGSRAWVATGGPRTAWRLVDDTVVGEAQQRPANEGAGFACGSPDPPRRRWTPRATQLARILRARTILRSPSWAWPLLRRDTSSRCCSRAMGTRHRGRPKQSRKHGVVWIATPASRSRDDGVDGRRTASKVPDWWFREHQQRAPSAMKARMIGWDLAKNVFQVHGVDAEGVAVLRKRLRRGQMERFCAGLAPAVGGRRAAGRTMGRGCCARSATRCGCWRRPTSSPRSSATRPTAAPPKRSARRCRARACGSSGSRLGSELGPVTRGWR